MQYKQLQAAMVAHYGARAETSAAWPVRLKNLCYTLKAFMKHRKLLADSNVGDELGARFDECRNAFLENYRSKGISPQYLRDKKSMMQVWYDLFITNTPSKQERATLRDAIARIFDSTGLSPESLGRKTSIAPTTLIYWREGRRTPSRKSHAALSRLEVFAGLEPGTLWSLCKGRRRSPPLPVVPPSAFRIRARERNKHPLNYLRDSELPRRAREDWLDLVRFKTDTVCLSRDGVWSLRPISEVQRSQVSWANTIDLSASATAGLVWIKVRAFLSFLARPKGAAGEGLPVESLSIAHLIRFESVVRYTNFIAKRAGGVGMGIKDAIPIAHAGITSLLAVLINCTKPITGYLPQHPELGHRIGIEDEAEWIRLCAVAHEKYRQLKKGLKRTWATSRDPFAEIKHITDQPQPMVAIRDILNTMWSDLETMTPGSIERAILGRDLALVSLLISNPLRARQVAEMTWRADGTGNLCKNGDGYGISFSAEDFKGTPGANTTQPYKMNISTLAVKAIDEYVTVHRPILLANGELTDRVFIRSTPSAPGKPGRDAPWDKLNRAVERITRRYFGNHFGPHSFRHIVATCYLRAHPEGFLTVSHILHDKLETVLKTYAHLAVGHQFEKYNAWAEQAMA